jgi:hypothetical protein
MTRAATARLAGFTFLFYVVVGIASMTMTGHAGVTSVLAVLTSFCALVLGVTLWAITREVDPDLAMMALACRVIEAVPGQGEIYFCRWQHAVLVASSSWPYDSSNTGHGPHRLHGSCGYQCWYSKWCWRCGCSSKVWPPNTPAWIRRALRRHGEW